MKILVCLKEAIDPALALDFGLDNPVVFRQGLPRRLDPASATALQKALEIKAAAGGAGITAVSIGPERVEDYLRDALALGADRAVRLPDDGSGTSYRKAVLLAALAKLENADLVLSGSRSPDMGSGQVAGLVAARLGWPCIIDSISLQFEGESVLTVRDIGRGEREKVRSPLPAVVACKGAGQLPYASVERLIASRQAEVARLAPADLGVSTLELKNEPTRVRGLVFPRPALRKAPPLDSSLPAFDRILQLLQGGIARRRSLMLSGDTGAMVERLFEMLKEEGAIRPAGEQ